MDIQTSVNRILASEEVFGNSFYEVFFRRYPDVQKYFSATEMKRQAALLTTAMILVEKYASEPNPAIEQYLQYLGSKHHERGIPRELYAHWREAMLETLAAFHGNEWNDVAEQQWRQAIDRTTEVMFQGYEAHFHA
jgi:hemoglobin-like flavoprotein